LPKAPAQERSRKKREALLAAASACFGERGYDATSVEQIATLANVAVGSFYQHFASKRQLLLVLVDRLMGDIEALDFRLAASSGDGRTAVELLVRSGLQADWSHSGVYRAWREAVLGDATLAKLHERIDRYGAGLIALALEAIRAFPEARDDFDPQVLAAILNRLFWQIAETPVAERPRVADAVVDLVVHAVIRDAR
jgi:AcrR family transcriptional regulator